MLPPRPGAPPRAFAWLVAIGFVLVTLPGLIQKYTPNAWLVGDGGFYLNMQKSLTERATLEQSGTHPASWYSGHRDINDAFSNISLGRNGEWWPKHGYLMPIASLPFYWVFGVPGTLIFNVLTVTGVLVLGYALARRFAGPGVAAAAASVVGLVGPHGEYAYNYSNDGFYTLFVLGAFLSALEALSPADATDADKERRYRLLAGFLFGVAIWVKITNALFAPLLAVIILDGAWREPRVALRRLLETAVGGAVPLALYGAMNWYMFGSPFVTSYQRVLIVKGGELGVASHTALFTTPLKKGLEDLLFTEGRGLLTRYAPLTVFWLGLIPMVRRRETRVFAGALVVTAVSFALFFCRFKYYHERFLFPYFGLVTIPGAVLLHAVIERWHRPLISRTAGRVFAVAASLALIASSWWISRSREAEGRLSGRIESARVYLDEKRCDYFNNMRWSWECEGSRGDDQYIGVSGAQEHPFGPGNAKGMILAAGHESRKPVKIVFPNTPLGPSLRFRYGLDDKSRGPVKVDLTVRVGDDEVYRTTLTDIGRLLEAQFDTTPYAGRADIVVTIATRDREKARFVFEGYSPQ
jgi:hypothetical protein